MDSECAKLRLTIGRLTAERDHARAQVVKAMSYGARGRQAAHRGRQATLAAERTLRFAAYELVNGAQKREEVADWLRACAYDMRCALDGRELIEEGQALQAEWEAAVDRVETLEAQLRAAEAKLRTVDDVICWGVDCVHQAACSQHCLDADEQLAAADALAGAVREACGPQCGCRAAQALAAYDAARGER